MPTKSWMEIRANKLSPAARARVERAVRYELEDAGDYAPVPGASALDISVTGGMDLREARKASGKTQAEISKAADMSQGEVSRLEHRDDFRLSTLRRYVQALGGELELVARFRDKVVVLRPSAGSEL